ncbi:DEAD/DEAH box helicase domain-containing protein [Toxoplasma gondii TgCatPRC2]|uniref:DEAD/DEAH box helicase domain-containing protein n=1 Tax=Toxoplasma gondii TgCatPRC2 TaxID=1130821 RepID=A0A151H1M3_TOXGO|nr:DEAD/DEAH box helicase domain-containing protein [Toxoplasma gondii TgCatPRC2]
MDGPMEAQARGLSGESRAEELKEQPESFEGGDGGEGVEGATNTLYVSNLPTRMSVAEIRRIFEELAEVQDCRIVSNPVTRESRGFAFVSLRDASKLQAVIDRLDGNVFPGDSTRPLRIERAKRNQPHQPTPGYYKGPPGASVKYDKLGRLRPGFLPYYAVAPGSSREFPRTTRSFFSGENGRASVGRSPESLRCMQKSSAWMPPLYGFPPRESSYAACLPGPHDFFQPNPRDACRARRWSREDFLGFFDALPPYVDPRVAAYEDDRRGRDRARRPRSGSEEQWRERRDRGSRRMERDRDLYADRRGGGGAFYDLRVDEGPSRRGYGDCMPGHSPGFEGGGGRDRERRMRDKSRSRDRGGRRAKWRSVSSSPRRRYASRR